MHEIIIYRPVPADIKDLKKGDLFSLAGCAGKSPLKVALDDPTQQDSGHHAGVWGVTAIDIGKVPQTYREQVR